MGANNSPGSYRTSKGMLNTVLSKPGNKNVNHVRPKKPAAVFPEPEVDDMEIEKQLNFIEGLSNESECTWLSSDSKSSPFHTSDDSQDAWEFDCWASLHDHFSSMLSLSGSCDVPVGTHGVVAVFDGSGINPVKDVPHVCKAEKEGNHGGKLQKEGVIWPQIAVGNEVKESSVGCSESSDSPCERSPCEDSSLFESSCTSLSTVEDLTSHVRDFDRTDTWVSSMDLKAEDTEWVAEKGQNFNVFDSDFPSPSVSARRNLRTRPSDSSPETCWWATEVCNHLNVSESDEPIFWPFDYISYYCAELDKFLCISPRKEGRNVKALGADGSKLLRLRLHQKRSSPLGKKNIQEGCRRKLIFSSTPTSNSSEGKTRILGSAVLKIGPVPSRLSRSTQSPSEENPSKISMNRKTLQLRANRKEHCGDQGLLSKPLLDREAKENPRKISLNRKPHQLKADRRKHYGDQGLLAKPLLDLEASEIQQFVADGAPIEELIGLHEFDGHEGITLGFNEDELCLVESPCKNAQANSVRNIERSFNANSHDSCSHVTSGSCLSDLVMDDCSEAHAKTHDDFLINSRQDASLPPLWSGAMSSAAMSWPFASHALLVSVIT